MKIQDAIQLFRDELKNLYSADEIENFIFSSMNEYFGFTRRHLQLKANQTLGEKETERFKIILSELKNHKPIQYILGRTEFYGLKIRVNEYVLIPRPETEELVEMILKESPNAGNILDIGTGSGCIAIALKKNISDATVSALDISDEALLIAKSNAILNQTHVNFLQADILQASNPPFSGFLLSQSGKGEREKRRSGEGTSFDVIVSNPPYIRHSEKSTMSKNVLDYEPHIALFVNDDDALVFYKAISDFALQNLSPDGKLYFEINESLGKEVKHLLEGNGFKNVEVKKDMSGKDRIAVGSLQ